MALTGAYLCRSLVLEIFFGQALFYALYNILYVHPIVDGDAYVWGRNEKGQLGLGDIITRDYPVRITGNEQYQAGKLLATERVINAAV